MEMFINNKHPVTEHMEDIFKRLGVKRIDFDSKGKVSYVGGSFKKSDFHKVSSTNELKKKLK